MSESTAPEPAKRAGPIRRILSILLMGLAAVFLVRTAQDVGWRVLAERLANADPTLLAVVVLVNLGRYVIWAKRWQILTRPIARVPWWPAQKALMASLFFTTVVPGSRPFGGLVRARYLGKEVGQPTGPLYGAAVVDQFGYSVVSMSLGAVYLPFVFWGGRFVDSSPVLPLLGLVALTVAAIVVWRQRFALRERVRRRLPRVALALEGTVDSASRLLVSPSSWAVLLVGGAAVWWTNVLGYQLAAATLGFRMDFAAAAAAFSLGSLAGTVTGTPGGAGATEAGAVLPLTQMGIPADVALASVLLARGVHYACSLGIGGLHALMGPRETPEPASSPEAPPDRG